MGTAWKTYSLCFPLLPLCFRMLMARRTWDFPQTGAMVKLLLFYRCKHTYIWSLSLVPAQRFKNPWDFLSDRGVFCHSERPLSDQTTSEFVPTRWLMVGSWVVSREGLATPEGRACDQRIGTLNPMPQSSAGQRGQRLSSFTSEQWFNQCAQVIKPL